MIADRLFVHFHYMNLVMVAVLRFWPFSRGVKEFPRRKSKWWRRKRNWLWEHQVIRLGRSFKHTQLELYQNKWFREYAMRKRSKLWRNNEILKRNFFFTMFLCCRMTLAIFWKGVFNLKFLLERLIIVEWSLQALLLLQVSSWDWYAVLGTM